ncbi:MAG: hypothetical protein M0R77_02760 [Gammaproteobacteria bacterium]|nr:hypothetical protein [Gammaproteobacteria bacterium]
MKELSFEIKDYTDIVTMDKTRYGICKYTNRLLTVDELNDLAKKYNCDFEIQWVYDYAENRSVPASFIMKMEDHMHSAFIITET